MNERVHGCRGGHYDMQRQRQANAAAEFRGDPLPHPYLPQLAPRSQAFCSLVSIFSNLLSYQLLRTHSLTHSLTTYYLLAGAVWRGLLSRRAGAAQSTRCLSCCACHRLAGTRAVTHSLNPTPNLTLTFYEPTLNH
jgi:hypothetical protein